MIAADQRHDVPNRTTRKHDNDGDIDIYVRTGSTTERFALPAGDPLGNARNPDGLSVDAYLTHLGAELTASRVPCSFLNGKYWKDNSGDPLVFTGTYPYTTMLITRRQYERIFKQDPRRGSSTWFLRAGGRRIKGIHITKYGHRETSPFQTRTL